METGKDIPIDMTVASLEFVTESDIGSGKKSRVRFYYRVNSKEMGGIWLYFGNVLQYKMGFCNRYAELNHQVDGPSLIWRITKQDTVFMIHCNGVLVMELDVVSDDYFDNCRKQWQQLVEKVVFSDETGKLDTASVKYRIVPQDFTGKYHIVP